MKALTKQKRKTSGSQFELVEVISLATGNSANPLIRGVHLKLTRHSSHHLANIIS